MKKGLVLVIMALAIFVYGDASAQARGKHYSYAKKSHKHYKKSHHKNVAYYDGRYRQRRVVHVPPGHAKKYYSRRPARVYAPVYRIQPVYPVYPRTAASVSFSFYR